MNKTLLLGIVGVAVLSGCAKKGDDGATASAAASSSATGATMNATATAAAPAQAAPAAAPAAAGAISGACEALGCAGDGSFGKMCDCKDKPAASPFTVKATGKKVGGRPEWEVTNTSDKPTHWASLAVYYYDREGKQLTAESPNGKFRVGRENGSTFTLKAKETRKIGAGFSDKLEPKGTTSTELVVDGWCYGTYEDKASHVCIRNAKAPDDRARAGR